MSLKRSKIPVSVLTTSIRITTTRRDVDEAVETTEAGEDGEESEGGEYLENLRWVLCILYPIFFWKKSVPVLAIFDLGSKVNAIDLTYAKELGLPIRPTNVWAQKIDSTIFDTYRMVVAAFLVTDKVNQVRFSEKRPSW